MVTRRARAGLTILEMMVAIALATMVVLIVGGAFQLVVMRYTDDTGSRGEGERSERVRSVLLSQVAWLDLEPDHTARMFRGAPNSLEFRTLVGADDPHLRRSTAVRYLIEPVADAPPSQRLVYRERGMRPEDLDREDHTGEPAGVSEARASVIVDALRESSRGAVLIAGAKSIRFEYLRLNAGEATWLPAWTEPNSVPRAVRVTFEEHSGEVRRWVLPVMATF